MVLFKAEQLGDGRDLGRIPGGERGSGLLQAHPGRAVVDKHPATVILLTYTMS